MLDHEFPEGFKPVNIEAYDGTTDPGVWIEDFILHIPLLGKRLAAARVLDVSVARGYALQLTHSSSACSPALLLHKCSSSAVSGSSLLLVALARFAWTRYCYRGATANFYTLATANLNSFFWHICFVFEPAL